MQYWTPAGPASMRGCDALLSMPFQEPAARKLVLLRHLLNSFVSRISTLTGARKLYNLSPMPSDTSLTVLCNGKTVSQAPQTTTCANQVGTYQEVADLLRWG